MKKIIHCGFTVLCLMIWSAGCRTASQSQPADHGPGTAQVQRVRPEALHFPKPAQASHDASLFHSGQLKRLDHAVEQAIREKKLPGGVLWFQSGSYVFERAYGQRRVAPDPEAMTQDTLFDAASLTKVIATTPAIMKLVEDGRLDLNAPIHTYLPAFKGEGKDRVTLRHLMTHTSGLRPGLSLREDWSGLAEAVRRACAESLVTDPGTQFRYSDINFILLGEIVHRVSGKSLDAFVLEHVFEPLGMRHTRFLPPASWRSLIAPTTRVGDAYLRGVVHDPTSRRMGGVAGHAGLFTCAADLARFARMMLGKGTVDGVRIFKPETVTLMASVQSPENVPAKRGLGWDIASPYSSPRGLHFPIGSYGHTGWTGTSIWMVPQSDTFLIFLSNRNHPTEDGSVVALRRELATIAAESIPGYGLDPDATALNGIDVLKLEGFRRLKGLKVGLITNHTGQDLHRRSTIDLLHDHASVHLQALFSPEHGIRGQLDGEVADGKDDRTGLPIHSLYGAHRQPQAEHLTGLDALVFDIQDIGCRFYTYISTMGLAMEAASKAGLKFFVLDRVNPINGLQVEGPVLLGETDFVGFHPIPIRHGMTVGELAWMFKEEQQLPLDLRVVPVRHWKRDMALDATGQAWTSPSPNMRNLKQAWLYPGIGILETTHLSVGRGTDTPFEIFGAPFIHDLELAAALNRLALPGVSFTPIRFTPESSKFAGEMCQGVYLSILDRARVQPVELGIQIALTLHRLYPEAWETGGLNRLLRHPPTVQGVESDASMESLRKAWEQDHAQFLKRREAFLMY